MSAVADTLASEFAGLGDLESLTRIVVRLLLAALLGGLLGVERELSHKAAGLRTHMLVALGSAMFVVAVSEAGFDDDGMARVVQGLLAGIGFLCAGSILKGSEKGHIYGLTTAAGMWMTAAIGVAAGLGREVLAVLSTVLTLGIISALKPIERRLDHHRRKHQAATGIELPPSSRED